MSTDDARAWRDQMVRGIGLSPGLYPGVPMAQYLKLPGIGSGHLGWILRSPKHYRHCLSHPPKDTDATENGTALHAALLEPETFSGRYAIEPDPAVIGGDRPRSTKAYRDEVSKMVASGFAVLKTDDFNSVHAMVRAVQDHKHAVRILERATEREQTMIWERTVSDAHLCRGRADLLGDRMLADVKTTRSLERFSPWVISDQGYHRQMAWYVDGLAQLGRVIDFVYLIAIENVPPYDVGVFVLDPDALRVGRDECDRALERLSECEESGKWPGMFEEIQHGMVVDRLMAEIHEGGLE